MRWPLKGTLGLYFLYIPIKLTLSNPSNISSISLYYKYRERENITHIGIHHIASLVFNVIKYKKYLFNTLSITIQAVLMSLFLAFDFCLFSVVIRFVHPRHNGQWPPTSKDFYTISYPLHYFLILILEKEPVFSF